MIFWVNSRMKLVNRLYG